jgi:L-2-hydroxyglutarate oxidase
LHDFVIVGGGIVGVSTAWQLQQRMPGSRVLLLEKETALAQHQTSHNSGVIHAGVYYTPGTLKAQFCREGVDATINFCRQNNVAYEQCGKLLVSTNELEHQRMLALLERGLENQLDLTLLNVDELRSMEPNIVGTGAILVRTSGIVSYRQVCLAMAERFQELGGEIRLGAEVAGLHESPEHISVRLSDGESVATKYLITCSGLMADRVTRMLGITTDFAVIPYRGEYYQLPDEKRDIVQHLIYPIPDPKLPFLGVHLTRTIDGSITIGPSALQGFKREGYGRINFNFRDTVEMLGFPGFWRISTANLGSAMTEIRNALWPRAYLQAVRKYCPSLTLADLRPYPAGVRAMAVTGAGEMVGDFLFASSPRSLHVCSAPSPAATSSIPIGRHICDKIEHASGKSCQ